MFRSGSRGAGFGRGSGFCGRCKEGGPRGGPRIEGLRRGEIIDEKLEARVGSIITRRREVHELLGMVC